MINDDELIQIFIEEAKDILEAFRDSFESWCKDPKKDDPLIQVLRQLHTFKGSARMVGLPELSEYIHCIEQFIEKIHTTKFYSKEDVIKIQETLNFLNLFITSLSHSPHAPQIPIPLDQLKETLNISKVQIKETIQP